MKRQRPTIVQKMMQRFLIIVPGLMAIFLCGCIYSFNPGGKSTIQSLSIERFDNKTPEFGLADRASDIVINAFIDEGTIKIVPQDNADAILYAVVTSYERRPNKFDENDVVSEYKIIIGFKVTLKNPDDQTEIWTESWKPEGVYKTATETEDVGELNAVNQLVDLVITRTSRAW